MKKLDPITETVRLALNEIIEFEYTTEPKTLLLSNEEAAIYWRTTGEKPKLYRVKEGWDVFTVDMPHDEALELIHGAKIDWWTKALYNNICGTAALYDWPKSPYTIWHERDITDDHINELRKNFTDDEITRETPYEERRRLVFEELRKDPKYEYWCDKNIWREVDRILKIRY